MSIAVYDIAYAEGRDTERARILALVEKVDATILDFVVNGHEEYEIVSHVIHLMLLPKIYDEKAQI